ncbi:MAG TPA: hypothetical protein VM265_00020 [Sphingomicrobium sp.]|nr:hypothetical protein [Sphingomicrobium sp.]
MKTALPLLPLLAALAACGGGGPVDKEANNVAGLPDPAEVAGGEIGTASADGSAPTNVLAPGGRAPLTSGDTASASQAAIPAALQGRWGMSPSDCIDNVGDGRGLLTVSDRELRYPASVARPARNVKTSANSLSGDFDFQGQGKSWTKFQALELQGDRLVRTESSPMASFTYVRCS